MSVPSLPALGQLHPRQWPAAPNLCFQIGMSEYSLVPENMSIAVLIGVHLTEAGGESQFMLTTGDE
jgi:hypothetical protein